MYIGVYVNISVLVVYPISNFLYLLYEFNTISVVCKYALLLGVIYATSGIHTHSTPHKKKLSNVYK